MGWEAVLTLAVVTAMFAALVRELAPADVVFLSATVVLAAAGVITPVEAFAGFSNPGMLTVAFLFIVAAGMRETGILDQLGNQVLGRAKTEPALLGRLAVVTLPMSAFLNNTPIVAMFVPILLNWSRRNRIAPSRLLIPLSFMTILGGTCTLIGTSTNLVVGGLMETQGMERMHMFEISKIGIPYAVVGLVYLYTIGRWLMPDRKEMLEQLGESRREFLIEMLVQPDCRLAGKSVEAAGLRHLPGLFLIEIDREGTFISPVAPDELLKVHDRLVFTGVVSSIVEVEKIAGLVPAADPSYEVTPELQRRRRLCEAVISANSPLIGKTIRDANFRARYGAAVVAVHRGGARVEKKIGDIELRPGDTLLLQTQPNFQRAYRNDPAFYLISDVEEWRPLRRDRSWVALIVFALLLAVMTTEILPTSLATALAAMAMVGMRCISAAEARRSVEWQVLVTIAAAFGIGSALQNSGAAEAIAAGVFRAIQSSGPLPALACVYGLGSLMTAVITNNAAAVLLFPLCVEIAELFGVSARPFLMALTLSASASFMTPIGYQTNLMIYGPGGYRFADFLRVGTPLTLLLWAVAVVLIPYVWPF